MENAETRLIEFYDVNNKEELFEKIALFLVFPPHFWKSWDALYDCLTDMSWMDQKNITIFHKRSFKLDNEDFKIYIKIWDDVSKYWKGNWGMEFEIIYSHCPYCLD